MRRNSGKKYVCTADLNSAPSFVYTQLEHTQKGIKNMLKVKNYQFWFCTGSQDLYGDECLSHVAAHSKEIVEKLNASGNLPYEVVWKPTLITNELIRKTMNEANMDDNCAGIITWMHTFSPAKSWILGLQELRKPLLHLHTQYNREIPYDTIDMDFMNENQAAHGDREYGHIFSRLHMERKVIMGYWEDKATQDRIGSWMRTAVGVLESSHIRVMRIADNMRNVAVTEGDKVEAQIKFGWEVDAYPVNEIAEAVKAVSKADIDALVEEYYSTYNILLEGRDEKEFRQHVAVQAGIEIGFERFLEEKNYQAIVTHFGDLGALQQLPGLAIQRLMAKGYGFGAEGDWKTAAMVRLMKIMTEGMKGELVALNKSDGTVKWRYTFQGYPWSSPVPVYDQNGKGYIIQCTKSGYIHLFDGLTGTLLDEMNLGSNVEASPAVFDNHIVIGTRGGLIYGIKLK